MREKFTIIFTVYWKWVAVVIAAVGIVWLCVVSVDPTKQKNDTAIQKSEIVTEDSEIGKDDNSYIATTYKDWKVYWRLCINTYHTNGFVIIKEIKTDEGRVYLIDESSNPELYIKNINLLNIFTGIKEDQIKAIRAFRTAEAIVIVSYNKKRFNVSEFEKEIWETGQRMIGRKEGLMLKSKVNLKGWK